MRATGIVCRVDNLGRVVIPKELRRTLHIHEGDLIDIFMDSEGDVIIKKYLPAREMKNVAMEYIKALSQVIDQGILITDLDTIIASAGGVKNEMIGISITQQMEDAIQEREKIMANKGDENFIKITNNGLDEYNSQIIWPILSKSEVIGAVAFLEKDVKIRMGETEQALAQCAASFLGRLIEQ